MALWTNADGLPVRLGTTEADAVKGGEYTTLGAERVYEQVIDYTDLAAYGTATVLANEVSIPKGAHIERVIVSVETAFTSGGSATLSLGLIQKDRSTTTGLGGTVLVATEAVATLVKGAVLEYKVGVSNVGAAVGGDNLTVDGLFTATAGTANFTAGRAKVRVLYTTP